MRHFAKKEQKKTFAYYYTHHNSNTISVRLCLFNIGRTLFIHTFQMLRELKFAVRTHNQKFGGNVSTSKVC